MAFWGGPGGTIQLGVGTLNVRGHKVRKKSISAQNNHTGVTADNYEPLLPAYEWELTAPWDDAFMPDVDFGLVENTKQTITFNDAASGKFCVITSTLVESIEEAYDVDEDVIVVVISGKGGTLTRQLT